MALEKTIDAPADVLKNWQSIVDLMAQIMDVPAGLIMRSIGPDIEVYLSSATEGNPYHAGDREHLHGSGLYCETVIRTRNHLLIPNALKDDDWKNNPDVKLNMISYLGYPINLPDGTPFGTLCVLDRKENHYNRTGMLLMEKFKALIESHLALSYMNMVLESENSRLTDYIAEIKTLRGIVPICASCHKIRDDQGFWQRVEAYIEEHSEARFTHGVCPDCLKRLYPEYSPDKNK